MKAERIKELREIVAGWKRLRGCENFLGSQGGIDRTTKLLDALESAQSENERYKAALEIISKKPSPQLACKDHCSLDIGCYPCDRIIAEQALEPEK